MNTKINGLVGIVKNSRKSRFAFSAYFVPKYVQRNKDLNEKKVNQKEWLYSFGKLVKHSLKIF